MRSLNKATVIGNLGADPESRNTSSGKTVTNLSVATSRSWTDDSGREQERTTWHRVVLWGGVARVAAEHLRKGDRVFIEGRLQTRSYEDDTGTTRRATEIIGRELIMLGHGRKGDRRSPEPEPERADGGLPF